MDYNRLRKFMQCLADCDGTDCDDCWLNKEYDSLSTCPADEAARDILGMLDLDRPDLRRGDFVMWTDEDKNVRYGRFMTAQSNGYSSIETKAPDDRIYILPVKSDKLEKAGRSREPAFQIGDCVLYKGQDGTGEIGYVKNSFGLCGYDEVVEVYKLDRAFHSIKLLAINCTKLELLNCKVKCVEANITMLGGKDWTVGKVYEIEDGRIKDDTGYVWGNNGKGYHDISELNNQLRSSYMAIARFVEYKEEPKSWNAKVKCNWVGQPNDSVWKLGKIYEVKDGTITDESGHIWRHVLGLPFDNLQNLNALMKLGTRSSATFEEVEEGWNGKVVCTEARDYMTVFNRGMIKCFTVGKIYEVKNGTVTDDQGYTWFDWRCRTKPRTFEEFNEHAEGGPKAKFVEIKE